MGKSNSFVVTMYIILCNLVTICVIDTSDPGFNIDNFFGEKKFKKTTIVHY